jgi:hypothetical protein
LVAVSYIYLASPYSHPDPAVREKRFEDACRKMAQYVNRGIPVFAPIVHTHPVADHLPPDKRMDFDLWMKMDLPILRMASELHILSIEGWRASRGVTRETEYAMQLGIPIKQVFMDIEP